MMIGGKGQRLAQPTLRVHSDTSWS